MGFISAVLSGGNPGDGNIIGGVDNPFQSGKTVWLPGAGGLNPLNSDSAVGQLTKDVGSINPFNSDTVMAGVFNNIGKDMGADPAKWVAIAAAVATGQVYLIPYINGVAALTKKNSSPEEWLTEGAKAYLISAGGEYVANNVTGVGPQTDITTGETFAGTGASGAAGSAQVGAVAGNISRNIFATAARQGTTNINGAQIVTGAITSEALNEAFKYMPGFDGLSKSDQSATVNAFKVAFNKDSNAAYQLFNQGFDATIKGLNDAAKSLGYGDLKQQNEVNNFVQSQGSTEDIDALNKLEQNIQDKYDAYAPLKAKNDAWFVKNDAYGIALNRYIAINNAPYHTYQTKKAAYDDVLAQWNWLQDPQNYYLPDVVEAAENEYVNTRALGVDNIVKTRTYINEGWDNLAQQKEATKLGYTTPEAYDTYLTDKKANEDAKTEGWTGSAQKSQAMTAGYTDPVQYDAYLGDKKAKDAAVAEGWTSLTQKNDAAAAGYTSPAKYDDYLVDKKANDAAIAAGWSGSTEKYTATTKGFDKPADYRTAVGLGIGTSAEYKDFQAKAPIYKEFTGKDATFNDIKNSSNLSVADFKNQISDKTEEEKVIAMLHDRGISPNAERVAAIMKGWDFNPATPSVGFSEAFDKSDKLSIANSRADSVQEAAALAKSLGYSGFSFGGSDYKINTSAPQGNPYDFFADKGEAFRAARADLGAGQVFPWTDPTTGKTGYYTTNYANEKVAGGGFDAGAAFNAKARLIDGLSDPSMNPADLKASEMANFVDGFVKATPQQRAAMLNGKDSLTYQQINNALTTTQQSLDDTYAAVKAGTFDPTKPIAGTGSIRPSDVTNYKQIVKATGNNIATDLASTSMSIANAVGSSLGLDTDGIEKMQKLMTSDRNKQMDKLDGLEKNAAAGFTSAIESAFSYALGGAPGAIGALTGFAANSAWLEGKEAGLSNADNAKRTAVMASLEAAGEAVGIPGLSKLMKGIPITGSVGDIINGVKSAALALGNEQVSELATTAAQFAVDKMANFGLGKNVSWGALSDALVDTAITTAFAVGGSGSIGQASRALRETSTAQDTQLWTQVTPDQLWSQAKDAGISQTDLNAIKQDIKNSFGSQSYTIQEAQQKLDQKLTDAGFTPQEIDRLTAPALNQEIIDKIKPSLQSAGVPADHLDAISSQVAQQILTANDQQAAFAGISTVLQNNGLDPLTSNLITNQTLTGTDVKTSIANTLKAQGYTPTQAEVDLLVSQNAKANPTSISKAITDYTGPRLVTADEAKAALMSSGLANPSQAQIDALTGQYDQNLLASRANTTTGDISTQISSLDAAALARDQTLSTTLNSISAQVAANQAAGMNSDQALGNAIDKVATSLGTTKQDLLTQMGKTEQSLKTEIAGVSTGLETQITGLDTKLSTAIAEAKASGLSGDQALQTAITKVATDLGTTSADILTQMGKSTADLKTQFATDLSAVSTSFETKLAASDAATKTAFEQMSADQKAEAKARVDQGETLQKSISDVQSGLGTQISDLATATQTQYNALSAADKAQADALVAQGKTLGDAIATVQSGVTGLSQTVADQYASLTAAQKSQADALVAQGKTTAEAIATVQQSVAGLGETVASQYASLTAAQKAEVDARVQQGQDLQAAITSASQATAGQIAGLSQTQATQFGELTQGQKDLYNQMVAQGTTQSEALTQAQAALQEQIKTGQEQTNQAITNLDQATQTKFDTLTDAQKQQALQLANSTKDLKGSIDAVSSIVVANQTDTQAKFDELKASQEAQKVADAERERLRLIEDARKEEERKAAEKDAANKAASKSLLEKMVATQAAGRQTQLTKGLSSLESAWPTSAGTALAALTPSVLTSKEMKPQFQGALSQFQKLTAEPYAGENQYQGLAPIIQQDQAMNESPFYSYGQSQSLDDIFGQGSQQSGGDQSFIDPLQSMTGSYAAGGLAGTRYGKYAGGGMATPLMAAGGKLRVDFRGGDAVTGAGDGQSDDIPAMLADGEFVFPADVVAAIGNGSTKAGSDKLYDMMHGIRSHVRSAHPKELPPEIKSPLDFLKTKPRKARS